MENPKWNQRSLDQLDPRKTGTRELKISPKPVAARDEPGKENGSDLERFGH